MKRNTYWCNILIIKAIEGSEFFSIGKTVNITLLLIFTLFLLLSCEHASKAELRQAANSASNDSTLWRSLQGFWRVEAIKTISTPRFSLMKPPISLKSTATQNGQIHFKTTQKMKKTLPR